MTGRLQESHIGSRENGSRPLDFVRVSVTLLKWWKFLVINTLILTVLTAIIVFLLPKWYRGTASILPPKDQGLMNIFGGTSSVLKGLGALPKLGGLNQNSISYNYFAILKSRSVMEAVVDHFHLFQVYGINDTSMESAVKQLRGNVTFEEQDDDFITIEVLDKDPNRAAAMANYFVEILNQKSIALATQEARGNREFIERRIVLLKDSLAVAEEALKNYQERSGVMVTPEQSSTIAAIAELYGLKARKEIELAVMQRTVSEDNELLLQAQMELDQIQKKLATFPQVGLQTYRLYRDVVTNQKMLEFLLPLYEQARVNEQKDVPVLLVLDKAVPPERKVRPQRVLIILSVGGVSFLFFVGLSILMQGLLDRERESSVIIPSLHQRVTRIAELYSINIR